MSRDSYFSNQNFSFFISKDKIFRFACGGFRLTLHAVRDEGNYELPHVYDDVIRHQYRCSRRVTSDESLYRSKKDPVFDMKNETLCYYIFIILI